MTPRWPARRHLTQAKQVPACSQQLYFREDAVRRKTARPQAKRSTLRNKADRAFSIYVRARDKVCQRCGTTEGLQCSHFISRRYLAVRFNPLNAEALCFRCHKFFTERPLEADQRAREQLGEYVYEELKRLALAGGLPDYTAVITELAA